MILIVKTWPWSSHLNGFSEVMIWEKGLHVYKLNVDNCMMCFRNNSFGSWKSEDGVASVNFQIKIAL